MRKFRQKLSDKNKFKHKLKNICKKKCCFGRSPNVSTNMMRDHQRKVPTKFGQDRSKTVRVVFLRFSLFWPMAQKAQ